MTRYLCCVFVALFALPVVAHESVDDMAAAASRFINTLDDAKKAKALLPFDIDKRKVWQYVPNRNRPGLKLSEMNGLQRAHAEAMLSKALTARGYSKALAVISLEAVLRDLENQNPIRDPGDYFVMIFGSPKGKTWGWRFEGHHLSLSFTIVDGKHISVTPSFFGANPGRVKDGKLKGLRVLADEEDLARALIKSLTPEQRAKAVIAAKAPRDILTRQKSKVDRKSFTPVKGIAFAALDEAQQTQLLKLVNVYTGHYRGDVIAQIHVRKPITDGKGMVFAWAGSTEPGEGHYYRIQSADFLIEYDNVQNGANHAHAVWRDFDGDFGEDLLLKHHEAHHAND